MKNSKLKQQEYFDRLAETTGEIWWGSSTPAGLRRLQRRAHLVIQKLSCFKDPMVLEIGCGTGAFSKFILKELSSLHLTGCDISPKAIEIAANRYDSYKHVCFEVADATSMHYNTSIFDAVIGNSILHHILPLEICLWECFRVLKPGGIIWFSEPNMLNPQIAIEKNVRFIGRLLQDTEDETAFFRWPLTKILRRIGFQDVSVQPFDFLHPIIPNSLIGIFDSVGRLFEKTPFLREISGSLLIYARKPCVGKSCINTKPYHA